MSSQMFEMEGMPLRLYHGTALRYSRQSAWHHSSREDATFGRKTRSYGLRSSLYDDFPIPFGKPYICFGLRHMSNDGEPLTPCPKFVAIWPW
jgi:hypothetical protein